MSGKTFLNHAKTTIYTHEQGKLNIKQDLCRK